MKYFIVNQSFHGAKNNNIYPFNNYLSDIAKLPFAVMALAPQIALLHYSISWTKSSMVSNCFLIYGK
jgi:hypothetical protein